MKVDVEHSDLCVICKKPNGIWLMCKDCCKRELDIERWREHAEEDRSWYE